MRNRQFHIYIIYRYIKNIDISLSPSVNVTVDPNMKPPCNEFVFTPLSSSLIDRMLQRDPKQRASLEEIESHVWLRGVDPSPATKCNTPLISHKNLSEEEHNSIIQRMVLGDIADREAITE